MSNEWQHGLFGCFDNCTVCIITYLAPCFTAGKNAEAVGESCLLCGLVQLVPLANIYFGGTIRQKIREQKGIEGSFLGDLAVTFCCICCAFAQEAQEVNSLGGGMSQDMERQ